MKETLYSWVESLVCYYLLFSTVMNFLPDNSYKKYVRYYMGLLLIFILLHPAFQIIGIQEILDQYVEQWNVMQEGIP